MLGQGVSCSFWITGDSISRGLVSQNRALSAYLKAIGSFCGEK